MGAKCPMNMQFTLGQLLSYPLLEYSDAIFRVSGLARDWPGETLSLRLLLLGGL